MKRGAAFVVVVVLVLLHPVVCGQSEPGESPSGSSRSSGASTSGGPAPQEQAVAGDPARPPQAPASLPPQAREARALVMREMAKLQEQHRIHISELEAVKRLAVKEKARETTEALSNLIARYQGQYELQMQALQRRFKALQGQPQVRSGAQDHTPTADLQKAGDSAKGKSEKAGAGNSRPDDPKKR